MNTDRKALIGELPSSQPCQASAAGAIAVVVCLLIGSSVFPAACAGADLDAQIQKLTVPESVFASAEAPQPEQPPPEPTRGEMGMPGPDLGRQSLLQRRTRPRLFQLYSDTQYLYDSNVLLADGDFVQEGEDSVFIQTFGASFSPPRLEHLASTLCWHHDMARYDAFSKFDFDGDTGGLQLSYPVRDLFNVYGGWFAGRSYFRKHGSEFFKFYDTQFGVGREQPLGRRALLVCGYQFDWRPSSPSELTRVDNAGYLGVNVALVDKLTAQFFYRVRAREYLQTDRTDVDHLLNFTLAYAFNNHVSARVSTTYGQNDSTVDTHDYRVFTAGGGLNLSIKF